MNLVFLSSSFLTNFGIGLVFIGWGIYCFRLMQEAKRKTNQTQMSKRKIQKDFLTDVFVGLLFVAVILLALMFSTFFMNR